MSVSYRSVFRLGTRGSALAQTEWVAQRLRAAGMEVRIVPVRTAGDACSAPVTDIGGEVFVSALREALVAGEVDAAVHSYKDLPTAADPRRASQLRVLGSGLQVVSIRGNVDSRIRRVIDGELDGVVVAAAGLVPISSRTSATTDGWCCSCPCGGVAATADDDLLRSSATGELTDAENLGRHVAAELLDLGANAASGTPLAATPTNIADGAPPTLSA
jgi:porphobilinogen deaminase